MADQGGTAPFVSEAGGMVGGIGAVKANNGELWTPPMTPRFVR